MEGGGLLSIGGSSAFGTNYAWRVRQQGWALWTTEPADPEQERRRLIEAATGLNAETLEANLADKGLAIVRAEEVPGE